MIGSLVTVALGLFLTSRDDWRASLFGGFLIVGVWVHGVAVLRGDVDSLDEGRDYSSLYIGLFSLLAFLAAVWIINLMLRWRRWARARR